MLLFAIEASLTFCVRDEFVHVRLMPLFILQTVFASAYLYTNMEP